MGNLKERVAYLQGLTQGLSINEHSAEGKLILNIIEVLDEVADEFDDMALAHNDLEEYVETIDEDLTELEEIYDDDKNYVEVDCPHCHERVSFESDILEEPGEVEVTCPYCGDVVYNSYDFDETNPVHIGSVTSVGDMRQTIHPGL
jgi:DNA-directed RNA polymerase subunit RPC12/RpoP